MVHKCVYLYQYKSQSQKGVLGRMFMQETDIYTRFRLADCVSRMTSPPHYIGRKWPVDRGLE